MGKLIYTSGHICGDMNIAEMQSQTFSTSGMITGFDFVAFEHGGSHVTATEYKETL
jgi:hypothetical protein